jgi:23S rRNA (uracil1939-C5)-methyltransferase
VLSPGQTLDLVVEKPAAGGRMIARADGQVVLVSGAVPGERVTARVERTERRLAFASVVDVNEPSTDRRAGFADPACGGCVYSHIVYPRQLTLKSEIVRDTFLRLGRITIDGPLDVAPSPEHGYRMRSRFHVDGVRFGFYREGTHALCDAAGTRQVSEAALRAVASVVDSLADSGARASSITLVERIELTESVDGSQRALSITLDGDRPAAETALARIGTSSGLTGCTVWTAAGGSVESGDPHVVDSLAVLTGGRVTPGELRRHAASFFQANRFLVPDLVAAVLDSVTAGPIYDLYAGVGLFSIALALAGAREITAVEGDRMSGIDLRHNARAAATAADAVRVVHDSVEHFLHASGSRPGARPCTVIVDPPRTGISAAAMASLVKIGAPQLVYVSCDPATMARDARRLLDGGYRLESLRAFDLFPNTPHVECVGAFGSA